MQSFWGMREGGRRGEFGEERRPGMRERKFCKETEGQIFFRI
jgi:hypothetical protein